MQKSEKKCKAKENLLRRDGEKAGKLSKYFSDALQKKQKHRLSVNKCHFSENKWLLFRNKWHLLRNKSLARVRPITLLAERRSAPCCAADSREVSRRQQGAEWRFAGKVVT